MSKKLSGFAKRWGDRLRLRRTLRQATPLHFVFAERIDYLNPAHWDALLAGRHLLMSRDYLRAMEAAGTEGMEHRYAMAYEGTRPLAAVAVQLLDVGLDRFHATRAAKGLPKEGSLIAAINENVEPRLQQKLMVCGNMLSYGLDGVASDPELDPFTRWHAVAEMLYRLRRAEKLNGQIDFIMIKDLDEAAHADSGMLRQLSYRAMSTEPNMVLELDPAWKTHADYLASMASKYRSSVKQQIFKPMEEAGCQLADLTLVEVAALAGRMQDQYLAVQDNASLRPVTVGERYWASMAALGPDRVRIRAVRKQGELLGFLLLLLDGETVTAAQIGFDRQAAKDLPLYLRLLHASVEVALDAGARRVVYGRTALEPKARMGCKPVVTRLWMRHRQPVLNAVIKHGFGLVKAPDAPAISPFKKTTA